jgi:hypothetical protein
MMADDRFAEAVENSDHRYPLPSDPFAAFFGNAGALLLAELP